MIRSMTGFATHTITLIHHNEKSQVTFSIKSLNSRYFEVSNKIAYPLLPLETEITKLLKDELLRGHVSITIHMSNQQLFKEPVEPAFSTIEKYINALRAIKEKFNVAGDISIESIMQLPTIFVSEEQPIDDQTKQHIISAIKIIISSLIASQEKEGKVLLLDIQDRIKYIAHEMGDIEKISAQLIETQKNKIRQTLQELAIDESKFAEAQKNALYAILDKMDIHEEITRFKSHLDNLLFQLQSKEIEKGKRLDFILQELAREINTIAAKGSDARISSHAINIKVELEKIREQVQNII